VAEQFRQDPFTITDIKILCLLVLLFSPIYLLYLDEIPFEITTDEISVTNTTQMIKNYSTGIFGFQGADNHNPAFQFYVYHYLALLIGNYSLHTIRLLHALSGLCIIGGSYLFFRILQARHFAIIATVLLGGCHTFFAISRSAMPNNMMLWPELAALILLFLGLKKNSLNYSFWGGMAAGLGFYLDYPARITYIVWIFFLILIYTFHKNVINKKMVVRLVAISLIGFIITITPMIKEMAKNPEVSLEYPISQILLFSEGQEYQRDWGSNSNPVKALLENSVHGITAFNNGLPDFSSRYFNEYAGFLDSLSGFLLWLGLIAILFKRRKTIEDFFIVSIFIFLYLYFSFLNTKNPHYFRLLIILPFVYYLITNGIFVLSDACATLWKKKKTIYSWLPTIMACLIVITNLKIYAFQQINKYDNVLSKSSWLFRYIKSRKSIENYKYIFIMKEDFTYFSEARPEIAWADILIQFKNESQTLDEVESHDMNRYFSTLPSDLDNFSLFLSHTDWNIVKEDFNLKYHDVSAVYYPPNKDYLIIEVKID